MSEEDDEEPSIEEWLEGYDAEVESGQTRISRQEAEERWYKKYGQQRHQNGDT